MHACSTPPTHGHAPGPPLGALLCMKTLHACCVSSTHGMHGAGRTSVCTWHSTSAQPYGHASLTPPAARCFPDACSLSIPPPSIQLLDGWMDHVTAYGALEMLPQPPRSPQTAPPREFQTPCLSITPPGVCDSICYALASVTAPRTLPRSRWRVRRLWSPSTTSQ